MSVIFLVDVLQLSYIVFLSTRHNVLGKMQGSG